MLQPWIEVPVEDIRVTPPMSIHDSNFRIMFRNTDVIDATIKKLEELKTRMPSEEILAHV